MPKKTHELSSPREEALEICKRLGVPASVFADEGLPARTPILHHRLAEGHDLYIYSLPDPNLAGYAVTQTRHAPLERHPRPVQGLRRLAGRRRGVRARVGRGYPAFLVLWQGRA